MTQTIEQLQVNVAELEEDLLKTKLDLLTSYGESEELLGRIAELEEENARLKAESRDASLGLNDYYGRKLAAEQLNNKLLREALEAVIKVHGYESGIPVEAISTQASTEALDKYVAEKVKELEAELTAAYKSIDDNWTSHQKIVEANRQRDLAVEAMTRAIDMVGHPDNITYLQQTLDAIKESEAK